MAGSRFPPHEHVAAPGDRKSDAKVDGTTAFGKYQLFASLGRGGMADVYLSVARGPMGFNKLAVVKRLRPALAEEAGFRTMFLDEARLAARLNHPNIVHTYEVGEQDGVYFIAMEYLEGQPLNKVIKELARRDIPVAPTLAVRIVADALSGLGHAHELKDYDGRPLDIVHRDVSPHNVFVTYDGHTKLVDFGIAKAATSSQATEVGVLKGKVAYMSPEQAMGNKLDGRSNLFAMGVVLWELLARARLFPGENAANTIHKLMNEPIPRVAEARPDIDRELDDLVAHALQKNPDVRFQTAGEMRAALESWMTRQRIVARQEEVAQQMNALFASVRGEVQRQVQKHMSAITAAEDTQELRTLNAAALKRPDASGSSAHLIRLGLGGSGSGSGVLTSHGNHAASVAPGPPERAASRSNALPIVIVVGLFALAALAIVVFGRREHAPEGQPPTLATSAPPPAVSIPGPAPSQAIEPVPSAAQASASSSAKHNHLPLPPPAPHSPTPAKPPEDPGFLTVSSYPWAKVSEGGRVICPVTPCNKVPLGPGPHTLTFENGEQPLQRQTVSVTVKSNETSTKNVGFK